MTEDKLIEKVVEVDLDDIIDCDREQFLDLLSEKVFGDVYPCLMGIDYNIIGFKSPKTIIMDVSGTYEADEDEDDI